MSFLVGFFSRLGRISFVLFQKFGLILNISFELKVLHNLNLKGIRGRIKLPKCYEEPAKDPQGATKGAPLGPPRAQEGPVLEGRTAEIVLPCGRRAYFAKTVSC